MHIDVCWLVCLFAKVCLSHRNQHTTAVAFKHTDVFSFCSLWPGCGMTTTMRCSLVQNFSHISCLHRLVCSSIACSCYKLRVTSLCGVGRAVMCNMLAADRVSECIRAYCVLISLFLHMPMPRNGYWAMQLVEVRANCCVDDCPR